MIVILDLGSHENTVVARAVRALVIKLLKGLRKVIDRNANHCN